MDDPELDQLLNDLEEDVAREVRAVLSEVAEEFTRGLDTADEIVAARFSVTSIAREWAQRVHRIVRRLLHVVERAAGQAAKDVDGQLPDTWTDLPDRYDHGTLPPQLGDYVEQTEHLLRAVGDRLAEAALAELADGLNAGETIDELRARLRAAFNREGARLGEAREQRIAATEATRAWNTATLAAARALSGPDRPLVKQWRTRGDSRVRDAHRAADGQLKLLDEPFRVGGVDMQAPGDPTAPPELTVNCRCHLRLSTADRSASAAAPQEENSMATPAEEKPMVRAWSTPEPAALAFENQETGDGRIFAPGALAWGSGPLPLMYAEKNLGGHDGAELAGAISSMGRAGDRITGRGVLYLTTDAGWEAAHLLDQGAPLGVSVDLDDVELEVIDRTGDTAVSLTASFAAATVLPLTDGTYRIQAHTAPRWAATGTTLVASSHSIDLYTNADGTISREAARTLAPDLTAAAGDPDTGGTVVHTESTGDVLMRITRARVRGATLVSVPAFADARIVLEPVSEPQPADEPTLAAAAGSMREQVIHYVRSAPTPVTAREIADRFDLTIEAARAHLAGGAESGQLVRIARGRYIAAVDLPEGDILAAASGDLELPIVDDPDHPWDGDAAASRVLRWATNSSGIVDPDRLGRAFLYRDPDADPGTLAAYKLGFADVVDDRLLIIPRAVYAAAAVLQGAMGGVDIPADEQDRIRGRVETLYQRIADKFGDPHRAPWEDDTDMSDLEASAWRAMRDLPPMPAEWFRDPVAEGILTDDSPGVNYDRGRIYGWVAKAGVPHAGYPGRNITIDKLARDGIDFSHFLRQRFVLDDGSEVRAGAFTMNVGHDRDDQVVCETNVCQFDDTRFVAGIVTVGLNEKGMWFTGAAAPWMADTDKMILMACQPSYHLRKARKGWELRAVLSVPVPGHSTALVATGVAERANLALTAAAAAADVRDYDQQHEPEPHPDHAPDPAPASAQTLSEAITAALTSPQFLDLFADALQRREQERAAELAALTADITAIKTEITASADPTEEEN